MKIATITIFCNETFRIDNWLTYYSSYKNEISIHIIVNNGDTNDTKILKKKFPNSIVLYSPTTNMLAAYNMGYKEALKHKEIDAIAQITNDIKLSNNAFTYLYKELFKNDSIGAISPVLFNKDSNIINSYGADIDFSTMSFNCLYMGKLVNEVPNFIECTALPGGIFLVKRKVLEQIGFHDERIMMYADETDFGYKMNLLGYKQAATISVSAWHQHIFQPGKNIRNPMAAYYCGRNPIYLAKKYLSSKFVIKTTLHRIRIGSSSLLKCILFFKSKDDFKYSFFYFKGILAGIFMNK